MIRNMYTKGSSVMGGLLRMEITCVLYLMRNTILELEEN